jgi:CubicO group peptidase (beta-lactamase class C family)
MLKMKLLQILLLLSPLMIFGQNEARIKRIETNLIPSVVINGVDYEKSTIEELMKKENVPGLSIAFVDDGKISWTKTYGFADVEKKTKVTPDTLFAAASISKPLTALCVLKLVQNGTLNLDADVNDYLTSWKVPTNDFTKTEKVTLRRLLGHTAGIDNKVFKFYAATDKLPTTTQLLTGEKPSKDEAVTLKNTPGSLPNYSNAGYVIIQQLLEDVLKKPFDEIVDEIVLRPAKMNLSTIKQPIPKEFQAKAATGYFADGKKVTELTMPFMSAAGLFTTPSELGKLMIELQNEYVGLSAKILNKEMAHKLFERDNNSLGFFKSVNNKDILFYNKGHNDGFGSEFNGMLNKKQGVIIMSNGDLGHHTIEKIVRAVANEYRWDYLATKFYDLYKNEANEINSFGGKYEMPQDKITISQKDGKVYFQSEYGGNELQEIFPIAKNQFINPKIPLTITFTSNENKVVVGLTIEAFGQIYNAKKVKSETNPPSTTYKPDDQKLYDTIFRLDGEFFEAYNTCDKNPDKYAAFFSENIEFYHDQGGLMTSKQGIIDATKRNICGKVTRELVKDSIEVYPIKDYGAVEIGLHKFHNNAEPPDTPSKIGRFMMIWRNENNDWKITRVVSLH